MSQDDGRVALVSGGSHGIGAATVRRLAARGWDVSFCYRDDGPSVRQVEKEASELGVRVVAIQADVTDPAQVASWFRRAEDELGPVAAMVSCAGITRDLPLPLMAEDDWRAVIDGVFHLCLAAVSVMAKRRWGRIVAVSSVCGAYDHPAGGHDIFARPGIAGFVKALAGQTARFGINVNAVAPGLVAHDMADLVPERARGDLTETIAIRRFGDTAAVADLVAFLLSEEAADITGTVLEAPGVISLLTGATPGQTARRNGTCRGPKADSSRARTCRYGSLAPNNQPPIAVALAWVAIRGTSGPVRLDDATVLTLHPVAVYGTRAVALAVPVTARIISATAYSRHGEIATAIPFSQPGQVALFGAWLMPGQQGTARASAVIFSGRAGGYSGRATAHLGPWGICVTFSRPSALGCIPVTSPAPGTSVVFWKQDPLNYVVGTTSAARVVRLVFTAPGERSIQVRPVRIGGQKLFAVAFRGTAKSLSWKAYDNSGAVVASGRVAAPLGS